MATRTIERPSHRSAADSAFCSGRYLSVTSFTRDGAGVATPVWFVSDGTRLCAFTDLHSGKVRRIRRNPQVLVASCRVDGTLRSEAVPVRVEVLTSAAESEHVQMLLVARYKISYRVVMLCYRLGRRLRGKLSIPDGAAWPSPSTSRTRAGADGTARIIDALSAAAGRKRWRFETCLT